MAFAAATVLTNTERAMVSDRLKSTPATYSTSPKWIAIGTGATAAARTAVAGDTTLSTEAETRVVGTEAWFTTSITNDTYQVSGTFTMTAPRAVDEGGLFDALTTGHMIVSWTQLVDNFATSDQYTVTVRIQFL